MQARSYVNWKLRHFTAHSTRYDFKFADCEAAIAAALPQLQTLDMSCH
jgi:hypothetical protein